VGLRLSVKTVWLTPAGAQEVDDVLAAGNEQLGDQTPVTPLPGRLGAHERWRWLGQLPGKSVLPVGGSHPGRVASEGRDTDAAELLLAGLAAPAAAELDRVTVRDSRFVERATKGSLVELGVPAGTREAPDVDEGLDAGLTERLDQLLQWTQSVTDREHPMHTIALRMVGRGRRWLKP
jgi:hypothetical protein